MFQKSVCAMLLAAVILMTAGFTGFAADVGTSDQSPPLLETIMIQEDTAEMIVNMFIPQLTEAAVADQASRDTINRTILDAAQEHLANVREMREEDTRPTTTYALYYHYNVAAKDDILSILVYKADYTGGAHGMNYVIGYNVNLTTGKLMSLSNLFVAGSFNMSIKTINTRVALEIASDPEGGYYESSQIGAFTSIAADQTFYFSGSDLVIQFQPYDIAPYAAGAVSFRIPYSDLEPVYTEQIQAFLKDNEEIGTSDVMVNGEPAAAESERKPYLKDSVWMVPLRLTAETLGYTVEWDAQAGQAVVAGSAVKPGLDSYGSNTALGAAPEIVSDSMYVPMGYFTKVLKKSVGVFYERLYIYR